jgi:hypothetical protein
VVQRVVRQALEVILRRRDPTEIAIRPGAIEDRGGHARREVRHVTVLGARQTSRRIQIDPLQSGTFVKHGRNARQVGVVDQKIEILAGRQRGQGLEPAQHDVAHALAIETAQKPLDSQRMGNVPPRRRLPAPQHAECNQVKRPLRLVPQAKQRRTR